MQCAGGGGWDRARPCDGGQTWPSHSHCEPAICGVGVCTQEKGSGKGSAPPPKERWAIARVHKRQSAQKRRKKFGSAVAYKTRGTVLSQRMGREDASGQATDMCTYSGHAAHVAGHHRAVTTGLVCQLTTALTYSTPPPLLHQHPGGGGGATTTGPDATAPPAIRQNLGGGGGGLGGVAYKDRARPPPPRGPAH